MYFLALIGHGSPGSPKEALLACLVVLVLILGPILGLVWMAESHKEPSAAYYGEYQGNNTYYFRCVGGEFSNQLSAFLNDRPDLEVITKTPRQEGFHHETLGYYVLFRKKPIPTEQVK